MEKDFILASASKQRKELLEQINFVPADIVPADIDETPCKGEKPSAYVKRMAVEKARNIAKRFPNRIVLACDTIITSQTKIIQKAKSDAEQEDIMKALSGRAHKVLSAVCVIDGNGKERVRLNTTKITMKRLSNEEIKNYVATHEWVGCSGYKIEGCMAAFVKKIIGSYSGVVGLPLYETKNLLNAAGIK